MNLELWVKSLHGEAPGRLLWVCPGLEKLKVGGVEFGVESGGIGLERVVFVMAPPVRHSILSAVYDDRRGEERQLGRPLGVLSADIFGGSLLVVRSSVPDCAGARFDRLSFPDRTSFVSSSESQTVDIQSSMKARIGCLALALR